MQIFTLVSGDYVQGAAALCNSLCAAGFDGKLYVGYTGELDWKLSSYAPIVSHKIPNKLSILNYKPSFIMDHAVGAYLYIDADCIVTQGAMLDSLCELATLMPILCAEGIVPEHDIRRLMWRRYKGGSGCDGQQKSDHVHEINNIYYNTGFFGGDVRRDRWILEGWQKIIETALLGTGELFETPYLPMADQDCLNAFIQDERFAFSCISPPDVWYAASTLNPFLHVGVVKSPWLLHCTGMQKPWRHRFVPARVPNAYEEAWHHFSLEEARWACSHPELPKSVHSWLQGRYWGRMVARFKSLRNRVFSLN